MIKTQENISSSVRILSELLAGNEVGANENKELYNSFITDTEVEEYLYLICEELSIELYHYEDALFLSPGVQNKVFGYSNDEFKKEMKYNFDNIEMYTSYFVMMTIVTMFYKESDYDTHVRRLNRRDILAKVNEKIEALTDIDDLAEISSNLNYNFNEISKHWKKMRKFSLKGDDADTPKVSDRGKNNQYAFVNTVCNFMEREGLVRIDQNMDSILPQKRFKAIVYSYFQSRDNRNEVYDFVKSLSESEDEL